MKLIKKSEKLLLDKIKSMEEEQNLQTENLYIPDSLLEDDAVTSVDNQEPNYIPLRDNPVVYSIGKTGWQVSEIWKDVRLDSFCDD
jgi:hypothetical protein